MKIHSDPVGKMVQGRTWTVRFLLWQGVKFHGYQEH